MSLRIRVLLGIVILFAIAMTSVWMQSHKKRIDPETFDKLHDAMNEADVIALLGEPEPRKYNEGIPMAVRLVVGIDWEIVRSVQVNGPEATEIGIVERLEYVGPEYGISVSFNTSGKMARRTLLHKPTLSDPLEP